MHVVSILVSELSCVLQRGRGSLVIRASNITSNDFRPGVMLELDGAPWKVVGEDKLRLHATSTIAGYF